MTSRSVRPTYCARVRSTSTLKLGTVRRLLDARVGEAGDARGSGSAACWHRRSSRVRLVPRICRSIGAGAPKFRIWLTMSAGRNEKVVPGNSRGSSSRSGLRHSPAVGRWPSLQLDQDVAVRRADRAGVVVGHVDAADRHADIVDDGGDFVRRDDLADRLLRSSANWRRVSSTRVPTWRADMHQDLAGIDRGEEVAAEEGHQQRTKQRRSRGSRSRSRRAAPAPWCSSSR